MENFKEILLSQLLNGGKISEEMISSMLDNIDLIKTKAEELRVRPGDRGPQGSKGNQGPVGPKGPTGPAGIKGVAGDNGPIGDKGPTGDRGPTGATYCHGNCHSSCHSNCYNSCDG